jgi:energy-converting hydrogenase Eha subunit A
MNKADKTTNIKKCILLDLLFGASFGAIIGILYKLGILGHYIHNIFAIGIIGGTIGVLLQIYLEKIKNKYYGLENLNNK